MDMNLFEESFLGIIYIAELLFSIIKLIHLGLSDYLHLSPLFVKIYSLFYLYFFSFSILKFDLHHLKSLKI